jgi:hypothetical protein
VILKCLCCGFEAEFPDAEAAFKAGWDCPPHFTASPICCDLCPSVAAMGMVDHSAAHERWEREGRPREFDMRDLPPIDDLHRDLRCTCASPRREPCPVHPTVKDTAKITPRRLAREGRNE